MADRIDQLVLEALSRAITEPDGVPLFASKSRPGLFPNTAAGKQSARQCLDDGLLEVRRITKSGRTTVKFCAATTQGAARLLDQANLKQAAWKPAVLAHLEAWQAAGDCPLPDLYRRGRQTSPALTIGEFHDGLRQFHDHERIYLHPWTGPLYAIPEPPYALLVGHEIAYYASPRTRAG